MNRKAKFNILKAAVVVIGMCCLVDSYVDNYKLSQRIEELEQQTQAVEDVDIAPAAQVKDKSSKSKVKYIKYDIPNYDTHFKAYMSYKAITAVDSPQYKLQTKAWTDDNGLRRINDDYMIALGSYYSHTIGERFKITLKNGEEFTAIIGDMKADKHTDVHNQYRAVYDEYGNFVSASVIEFIVDTPSLPDKVKLSGTVSSISDFSGDIETIEKIVEE